MKTILLQLSASLLLLSAISSWVAVRQALSERRNLTGERQLLPRDGSLAGVGVDGNLITPRKTSKGQFSNHNHIVLFVIHHSRAATDIEFWNQVMALSTSNQPPVNGDALEFWGICDAGTSCNQPGNRAHFPMVGYMDPYQMRLVANANKRDVSLLYDDSASLVSRIPLLADVAAESALIRKEAMPK